MATDWAADIKKYAPDADDAVIAKLLSTYRLALGNKDSAYVAASDAAELDTVRKNFLKGKLGLTDDDAVLDAAIKDVTTTMKADRLKSRATVYYLLAAKFGKLDVFK
jgi:exosome complex RNA-binding protein Rrp4